jgi:hypothetical protein
MVTVSMLATGAATIRVSPEAFLVSLASLVTFLGGVYAIWHAVSKRAKKFDQFFRDWYGEEERPGVARRPGTNERIANLSDKFVSLEAKVDVIHSEVNYNHGGSIKDVVDRIETDVRGIHERLDKV